MDDQDWDNTIPGLSSIPQEVDAAMDSFAPQGQDQTDGAHMNHIIPQQNVASVLDAAGFEEDGLGAVNSLRDENIQQSQTVSETDEVADFVMPNDASSSSTAENAATRDVSVEEETLPTQSTVKDEVPTFPISVPVSDANRKQEHYGTVAEEDDYPEQHTLTQEQHVLEESKENCKKNNDFQQSVGCNIQESAPDSVENDVEEPVDITEPAIPDEAEIRSTQIKQTILDAAGNLKTPQQTNGTGTECEIAESHSMDLAGVASENISYDVQVEEPSKKLKGEPENEKDGDIVISNVIGKVKVKEESDNKKKKDMAAETTNESLKTKEMDGNKGKESVIDSTVNVREEKDRSEMKELESDSTPATKSSKKKKSDKSRAQKPCLVCKKVKKCKYNIVRNGSVRHLCDDDCFKVFRLNPSTFLKTEPEETSSARTDQCLAATPPTTAEEPNTTYVPHSAEVHEAKLSSTIHKTGMGGEKCAQCGIQRLPTGKAFVKWQKADFCDEKCLACYQTKVSGICEGCKLYLPPGSSAKFYLRQGTEVKQFCTSACLEQYKSKLKIRTVPTTRTLAKKYCAECNRDLMLDKNSFMAPAGPDGSFMEFCSESCSSKFETRPEKERNSIFSSLNNVHVTSNIYGNQVITPPTNSVGQCVVCKKRTIVKHTVRHAGSDKKLCSKTCLSKFQDEISKSQHCDVCHIVLTEVSHRMNFEGLTKTFCSSKCLVQFKMNKVRMVPCGWCGATKSNLDMIERVEMNNKISLFCSLNCLSLFRVNQQATANTSVKCDECNKVKPAQYHLTMSDASVRNFCSYPCVINFQGQFSNVSQSSVASTKTQQPFKASTTTTSRHPRASKAAANAKIQAVAQDELGKVPVISSVRSLAEQGTSTGTSTSLAQTPTKGPTQISHTTAQTAPQAAAQQITTTQGAQTTTQKIIIQHPEPKKVKNKFIMCKPVTATKGTACKPHMLTKETQTDNEYHTKSVFIPVPVPVYIPVPMAMYSIPVPYPLATPVPVPVPCFLPTTKKSTESILKQIKAIQEKIPADPFEAELLRMAEACEQAENPHSDTSDDSDNEDTVVKEELPQTTKGQMPGASQTLLPDSGEDILQEAMRLADEMSIPSINMSTALDDAQENEHFTTIEEDQEVLTPKKGRGSKRARGRNGGGAKRAKLEEDLPEPEPEVAPDAHLHLKFMYGVNAWKHWVNQKNGQLQKAATINKKIKTFKTDILQCTAEELCRSLCLFIKELRKPNGDEYNADSIYYLCLGIQQYLYENGRVDHIFSDLYYEQFTECLNQVLQRFEVRLNPEGMIVCRLEEEHLWESKQLGAHSPYVLLNTLIYFNTKYFMFRTPEEHLGFSFARIMKQWRKGTGKSGATREALLKYIPPVEVGASGKRKREEPAIYEQVENVNYPLRCPVKLYDFYLSKCPESIKNRTDLFYLMPERSCVPDSPVWFSANALSVDIMAKMLNRIRVVKEVQEAHLMDQTNVVWN